MSGLSTSLLQLVWKDVHVHGGAFVVGKPWFGVAIALAVPDKACASASYS